MEQMSESMVRKEFQGGARVAKGGGHGGLIALAVAAAVLAGGYLGLCAYAQNSAAVWRDTWVLGQNIGGLSQEDAARQVEQALPELEIGLYLYDGAEEAPPQRREAPDSALPLADLQAEIDVPALVQDADRAARSGPFLTAGFRYFFHGGTRYGGGNIRVDNAAALAEELTDALSLPVRDTEYTLEDSALLVTMATDGRTVEAGTLRQGLEDGSWCFDLGLDVPYQVTHGRTTTAQAIHDEVYGEVRNAGFDPEANAIIPEEVGADFDVAAAQAAMDGAEPGETVSVPAQIQLPAVTAEELSGLLFRDVLGEARTHVTGTANRITNVKLASAAFSGTVLNSGDVFSYNDVVGQRTVAKGYRAAPAYVSGETVDEIGGGVCQPSSTLYLACLRANLEITERSAHRYVPSYIEAGMDATVSWGGPDYKFTNNTNYPIRIVAEYDKGYLTVRLLGTNIDGSYVKMTHTTLSSTASQVIYQDDPSLAPGEEIVKTTPYTGYLVKSYRHVYAADGTLLSSAYEATSDYKVRNKVVLRGPAAEEASGTPPQNPGSLPVPGEPLPEDPPVPSVEVPEPPVADPDTPFIVLPDLAE